MYTQSWNLRNLEIVRIQECIMRERVTSGVCVLGKMVTLCLNLE